MLTLFCTFGGDQLAGGRGGSETTNGIMACVVYPDGAPASGSIVRLRKADYVSNVSALPKKRVVSADVITDSQGRFIINPGEMDTGSYHIEIINNVENSPQSGAVLFKVTIQMHKNGPDTVNLGTEMLLPFASLSGEIDSDVTEGRRLYVQIRGLERLAEVAPDGTFSFDDLPAGTHSVRVVDGGSAFVREVQNVQTSSGDTLTVKITESSNFSSFVQINTSDAGISYFDVIENFPLLVRLESPAFDFSKAHGAGNDIRFSKPNGQSLSYEIEEWNPILGKAAVWVLIDSIWGNRSDQFIVMSYGAPEASSLSDGSAVFHTDFGFSGVWHFNEDPSAGSGALKNRTANEFHGTASSSMTSANVVSGVAGSALIFDGENDNIQAGQLDLDGDYTLSCWIKIQQGDSIHTNWRFIIKERAYTLWYDNDDNRWGGFRAEHYSYIADEDSARWVGIYQDRDESRDLRPDHSAVFGVWAHIAATWDGDKIRLFINGQVVDSTSNIPQAQPPLSSNRQLLFGGRTEEHFKGTMDVVRIERVARPAEWIRLNYETQRIGSKIIRY